MLQKKFCCCCLHFCPRYMNMLTLYCHPLKLLLATSESARLPDTRRHSTPCSRPPGLRVVRGRRNRTHNRNVPSWLSIPSVCGDISRSQHDGLRSTYRYLHHFPGGSRRWNSGRVPGQITSMLDPGAVRRRVPRTMASVEK
jgi:hypothetical protein